jgi:hypothetical protein
MRLLLTLLLQACLFAQTVSRPPLTGIWVNEHETLGFTQVIVRRDGARTIVHAWGSCIPTDCDWGETDADLWNGILVAISKQGFATTRMQLIPLPDGRMVVASEAEFNDGSGRKDPGEPNSSYGRKSSPTPPRGYVRERCSGKRPRSTAIYLRRTSQRSQLRRLRPPERKCGLSRRKQYSRLLPIRFVLNPTAPENRLS